jgi:hypothetical protein
MSWLKAQRNCRRIRKSIRSGGIPNLWFNLQEARTLKRNKLQ